MGTMAFGSLYPGRPSAQESVNPPRGSGPASAAPGAAGTDWNIPVLTPTAGYLGIGVPMLIALGVLTWYLIERYD